MIGAGDERARASWGETGGRGVWRVEGRGRVAQEVRDGFRGREKYVSVETERRIGAEREGTCVCVRVRVSE